MAESLYAQVFFAHQDSNFLQEKLGVNSLFHVLQILQGIDLRIYIMTSTRIERSMLLRQRERKEKENSNEKAKKYNLGVNLEATWSPG